MKDEFVVYVLFSESARLTYIGFTTDLINRFKSHNIFSKKGFTIKHRPWKVIYVEFLSSKADALLREKQLKSGKGREWIHQEVISEAINIGLISA